MANIHIPDDIFKNILARLPRKPLVRFRCVSSHWNRLISDPYFMKSRSRRMILLPNQRPLAVIDDNVPVEDEAHSMFQIRSPLEHQEGTKVIIVGTFNGIVILALNDISYRTQLILYNPLTGASKILAVMDPPSMYGFPYFFGLAYGDGADATTYHDLKIVRFEFVVRRYVFDVFDLKTSLWSTPQYLPQDYYFWSDVGLFLNGVLYWIISLFHFGILALNVKEMIFSEINTPDVLGFCYKECYKAHRCPKQSESESHGALLGSLNGCLCMIDKYYSTTKFDVWVMKEQSGVKNPWFKACSFTFGLEGDLFNEFHPMCILGNGKILLTNGYNQIVIYDTTNDSYKSLNNFASHDEFKEISRVADFREIRSIEYVESLVSPSDVCF